MAIRQALVGTIVLGHISDPKSGILVDCGEWIPLTEPIENASLSATARTHRGSERIFFTCAWRLQWPGGRTESDFTKFDELIGRRINSVELAEPPTEIVVNFEGSRLLRIYTRLDPSDDTDAIFRSNDRSWEISSEGRIRWRRYEGRETT